VYVREYILDAMDAVRSWRPFRCRACLMKRVYLPSTCPRCTRLARQVWGHLHMGAPCHVKPAPTAYGFQVYRLVVDVQVRITADTRSLAESLRRASASMRALGNAFSRPQGPHGP
jgi:hypothetical protein